LRYYCCRFIHAFFLSQFIITGWFSVYYFSFKSDKVLREESEAKHISDVRNYQVLENMRKSISLDVSEYQGRIRWSYVDTLKKNTHCILCLFGLLLERRKDLQFNKIGSQENKMIRGAIITIVNENSLEQAALLLKQYDFKRRFTSVLNIENCLKPVD
jgi:lysozyme